MKLTNSIISFKYYFYTIFIQMRFTRIVAILFLINDLNISLIQYAMLQSSFSLSQFIMEVPSGILSDYFSNKTVVILGILITVLSQLIICSGLVVNSDYTYTILLFAYMIEGVGRAFISGSDDALFYKKIKENNLETLYGKILGKVNLVCAISVGIATFLGGVMYAYNSKIPYIGQIIFSLIAAIIIFSIKDKKEFSSQKIEIRKHQHLKKMLNEILTVSKNKEAIFMVLFISFTFAIIPTIFGLMPNYLDKLSFDPSENGMLFMLLSFIGGIVAVQSYRLDKLGVGCLIIITCIMMITGLIFLLPASNKINIFIGLVLFYTIIDVLEPIAMKSFNSYVSDNIRATFLSLISFITTAITMLLYPILGYVVESYSMNLLLTFTVVITVSLLTIAFIVYKSFEVRDNLGNK